mmetsp:Transcript_19044/g.31199  ORF Transcript_19044/g.31199 Transcript_19044/m.31199 type:complete len:764 (+) Transcript_19044:150-2441(+)|eukprot:CAMPEP_0184666576 /NCGR_PEP_ID=MMETSP0308-20130426/62482_1 /TAXON_ID=38269 /ORGANISM="Gloeochaete witrockiana, Strain SAG 46.84" /LENGTH=763 /DNA_ID=CAMNT_0027111255 /DNA_START=110 /DNA_END=2401 /DNA_ORIENTATION=+
MVDLSASATAAMEVHLKECIQFSLGNFLYSNAIFFSERLHALNPTEESHHLLATSYLRNGQPYRAYHLLRTFFSLKDASTVSPEVRYLFGICCYAMGKYQEAETALLPVSSSASSTPLVVDPSSVDVPNGAAGYYFLGQICCRANRRVQAIEYLTKSLKANPFMWCAYETLCSLGAEVEPSEIFACPPSAPSPVPPLDVSSVPESPTLPANASMPPPSARPPSSQDDVHLPVCTPVPSLPLKSTEATPSFTSSIIMPSPACTTPLSDNNTVTPVQQAQPAMRRKGRAEDLEDENKEKRRFAHRLSFASEHQQPVNSARGARLSYSAASLSTPVSAPQRSVKVKTRKPSRTTNHATEVDVVMRDSSPRTPALSSPGRSPATNNLHHVKQQHPANGLALPPAPRLERSSSSSSSIPKIDPSSQKSSSVGRRLVLELLRCLGAALQMLCHYKCQEAVDTFAQLPPSQYQTGWVLCNVGRAYFEMVNYSEAERMFEWARQVDPSRVAGMETYSTILWHEKKDVPLCFLAQQMVSLDRYAPQPWCVLGNCFSLQREHDIALKFFLRAQQVDPAFVYAYTLAGHEYVAKEDFARAFNMYRNAIRIDERHYNAWYGLGNVYYRQEKYELAEYHFRKALQINDRSSVLYCYMGMVLHANKKPDEALCMLDMAIEIDPKNPLARFKKAGVLVSQGDLEDALVELVILKELAPKEATVHFLMGKVYKKLKRPDAAVRHLMIALDLDPEKANVIKQAIEKVDIEETEEEDSEYT